MNKNSVEGRKRDEKFLWWLLFIICSLLFCFQIIISQEVQGIMDYTNFYIRPETRFWLKVFNRRNVAYYFVNTFQGNKCMCKICKRNTWKRCEICIKATRNAPQWRQRRRFNVFIVNFEHIPQVFIAFF